MVCKLRQQFGCIAFICLINDKDMRAALYFSSFVLFVFLSCESPTSTDDNQIIFRTVENSFSTTDSIKVIVENRTNSDYKIALRCGYYLEMYYQKRENNIWSKNLWFSWMASKCYSVLYTIKEDNSFQFIIPFEEIGIRGTYRLILATDTLMISNSFEIK